jgi:hypothetical protein
MLNVKALYSRGRYFLREQGAGTLLRRGLAFIGRFLFRNEYYYLYKHSLEARDEAEFRPRVEDFGFEIIFSTGRAVELAAEGIDICQLFPNAMHSLEKGAAAFCVFINNELAHIGWVATTEEAKQSIDDIPYHVDFANGEACTGGTRTAPKYGQRGLMVYGYFKRLDYLREKGCVLSRCAVTTDNVASQKAHAKFSPTIYAKAHFLKILWWQFWRETALDEGMVVP